MAVRAPWSEAVSGLWLGVLAGAVGMGYFIYGKRQAKYVPMIAGVLLCVYPVLPRKPAGRWVRSACCSSPHLS